MLIGAGLVCERVRGSTYMRPALQHVVGGIAITSALLCRFVDADTVCGAGARAYACGRACLSEWLCALFDPSMSLAGLPNAALTTF